MNSKIGGIYVINLDARPERWALFQSGSAHWQRMFGCAPQRCSAIAGVELPGYDAPPWFNKRISLQRKRSWAGKAGCILSHRQAIELAAEAGWETVLILEDDALLSEEVAADWETEISELIRTIPRDWCVVNLCTTTVFSPNRSILATQNTRLVETTGALGAVAYLLNGKVLRNILSELPERENIWEWVARHKTIDRWFSQNLVRFGRVFVFSPSIVGHHPGSSDTSMTPEHAALLDFTLADIRYHNGNLSYAVLRHLRILVNALGRVGSILRYYYKRAKGL